MVRPNKRQWIEVNTSHLSNQKLQNHQLTNICFQYCHQKFPTKIISCYILDVFCICCISCIISGYTLGLLRHLQRAGNRMVRNRCPTDSHLPTLRLTTHSLQSKTSLQLDVSSSRNQVSMMRRSPFQKFHDIDSSETNT